MKPAAVVHRLKDRVQELAEPGSFRVLAPRQSGEATIRSRPQRATGGTQAVKGGRRAVAEGDRDP
jgi:hypothetical protein